MNDPIFTSRLEDISAKRNSTVKLQCSLDQAVEHVKWYRGTEQLEVAVNTNGKQNEHSYEIANMSKDDIETYSCMYGSAVTSCRVTLNEEDTQTQQVELTLVEIEERYRRVLKEKRDLQAHINILLADKRKLERRILELEGNVNDNKDELKRCREEISDMKLKINSFEKTIALLEPDIAEYLSLLEKKNQEIEESRSEYQDIVQSQQNFLSENKTAFDRIKSENDDIKTFLTGFENNMEKRMLSLENEKLKAEQEKNEAIAKAEAKDAEINEMKSKITGMETEKSQEDQTKKEENEITEKESAENRARIQELEAKVKDKCSIS